LASVLGSTYTCEQPFPYMKHKKPKFRSRIAYVRLNVMWNGI
jgi:hypothetical protein